MREDNRCSPSMSSADVSIGMLVESSGRMMVSPPGVTTKLSLILTKHSLSNFCNKQKTNDDQLCPHAADFIYLLVAGKVNWAIGFERLAIESKLDLDVAYILML